MNIRKLLLHRNRHEGRFHLRKFCDFCVYTGFLFLFLTVPLILNAEDTETKTPAAATNGEAPTPENDAQNVERAENVDEASSNNDDSIPETTIEKITGTSKRMERYEKDGITILIDEAKTVRHNEQGIEIGFLNADKITLISDPETGTTTEIIAEGNVEIRDQDIFATCDHAIMNNLTNTIILRDNVVVLQNKDRLETTLFTFNRTTGKQTGEGGVKFKVTVTQAAPVDVETDENAENTENGNPGTGEAETPTTDPEKPEGDVQQETETETETPESNGDTAAQPNADVENAEGAESEEETDTNPENPDDTEPDPESEESEESEN